MQQHEREGCCEQPDILQISVEKGGTSVLADAYVAKGVPTPREVNFAFGYGVFLQLIDDMQDVEADGRRGHRTLFTLEAREGPLDAIANRLLRFINSVLSSWDLRTRPRTKVLAELVRKSCRSLVLESIALTPSLYSPAFIRTVEPSSPMRFSCIRKLHEGVRSKQDRLRKSFKGKRLVHLAAACV